jgi:uncharacterized protein YkwD
VGVSRALVALALLAVPCASCAAQPYASNGTKLGEALAFAAAAGAAQVAEAAMEQQARNNAPVTHASTGLNVSPACDNDGQYGCLSVSPSSADPTEPEMSDDDARDYVQQYLNGVRKLNGLGVLVRDDTLDAFAQAGSDELAQDHLPDQHMAVHAPELHVASAEIQGPADGSSPGPLQDQLATVLLRFAGEGRGGVHHDVMVRPEWRKLGVGIAHGNGRTYLTVDLAR